MTDSLSSTTPRIFTVSEIVRDTKVSLESMYPDVWIEGEITNVNCHSSGHCYFTLKDSNAQVGAAMFRDDFTRLRFRPANGLQVVVRGRLTIYPPRGQFQLVANAMEPKGKGSLQLAFEQLKTKLEKEGLFDESRKKPIPTLPQWIGIVTSFDGAALHDMLTVIHRRFAGLRILIIPVKVQGDGSAAEIAAAVNRLNRDYPELDVLLVGRGGGSMEDLWAFNEEIVARSYIASTIPIISCVGHETDFTIADFVADLRAATPSAAAELVTRAKAELIDHVENLLARLQIPVMHQLQELTQRLDHAFSSRLLQQPDAFIEILKDDVAALQARLQQTIENQTAHREKDTRHLFEKLHLLSPLATLSRGYSIARVLPERRVLINKEQVKPHDSIEIQLQQGRVYAQVERTEI